MKLRLPAANKFRCDSRLPEINHFNQRDGTVARPLSEAAGPYINQEITSLEPRRKCKLRKRGAPRTRDVFAEF